MKSFIDNCPLSNYRHQRESKRVEQSRAQHQTLRGRKHIYKNIVGSDSGRESGAFKCVQLANISAPPPSLFQILKLSKALLLTKVYKIRLI
jgi:hypothetical protein